MGLLEHARYLQATRKGDGQSRKFLVSKTIAALAMNQINHVKEAFFFELNSEYDRLYLYLAMPKYLHWRTDQTKIF